MPRTMRVLITDDEKGMRLGIERVLKKLEVSFGDLDTDVDFETVTADCGEEALEKLGSEKFDLLLLDYKLPGLSGLDVLDRLSGVEQRPLTVMITAFASLQTAISATKQGAYDFLAKPFTPDELKATVRKATHHLVLKERTRQLEEEKKRVRFEFISVLSHELKAPLNAVESYLQLLLQDSVPKDEAMLKHIATRSVHRLGGMRKLIFDLLDMTRIESGNKQRVMDAVDLVEVAKESIEISSAMADERGISIELNSSSEVVLQADRYELEIICNNLISNAVKYNRDAGTVKVTVEQTDGKTVFQVSDTGIGLAPEEQSKLFGEFVRIKNDKTRDIEGTGLGLSTVKKIVQLYGGDIQIESQPNEGTTFTVLI